MVDWIGSDELKKLSTQSQFDPRLKIKFQHKIPIHENQPEISS